MIGAFSLLMVGVSMLEKSGGSDVTVRYAEGKDAASGGAYEGSLGNQGFRNDKIILSGDVHRGPVNRTLIRNQGSDRPNREELRESLRDAHIAVTEERAQQAALARNNPAPQAAPAPVNQNTPPPPQKKMLEVAKGTVITDKNGANDPNAPKDYRRALLSQAVREALDSSEPWKELVAVAMIQAGLPDMVSARETIAIAKKLVPTTGDALLRGDRMISIVQAQVNIGLLDAALDTALNIANEEKKNQGISTVIWAHLARRQFSEAKTLASGLSMKQYKEGSFRNIAEAEANVGDMNPAMSTMALISNLDLKNDAIHRIAMAQARSQQWNSAASTAALIADVAKNQQVLSDIIRVRIDSGDISGAQSSVWGIKDKNQRDDLFGRIANRYASQADIPSAFRVAGMISDKNRQENIMASISVQQARLGDVAGGFNSAQSIKNSFAHTQAMRDVTLIEANNRGAAAARNMAALIENKDARDATYRAIANREVGQGKFNEAMNCIESISSNECRLNSQAEIAVAFLRRQTSREAIHLLEDTVSNLSTIPQESYERTRLVLTLSYGFALLNRFEESIGLIVDLPREGDRNNAYRQIALDCVARGEIEHAQSMARRIKDLNFQSRTLEEIAMRHANNVNPGDADKELRRFDTKEQRAQFLRGVASKR